MKRVGIIGGDEFLGCFISLKFLAENFQVKIPRYPVQQEKRVVILSGLFANRNLELCRIDLENNSHLLEFVSNCNIIIHCGFPVRLGTNNDGLFLYIPVIKGTAQLVKALKMAPMVEKVIFVTSPAVYDLCFIDESSLKTKKKPAKTTNNQQVINARFHADQVLQNALKFFPEDFFNVVVVAPVEVRNNEITCNSDSISTGLQLIFRNKIANDTVFQKICRRNVLPSLIKADDLPDRVFEVATLRSDTILKDDSLMQPG